jgi:hypothetical protein
MGLHRKLQNNKLGSWITTVCDANPAIPLIARLSHAYPAAADVKGREIAKIRMQIAIYWTTENDSLVGCRFRMEDVDAVA